MTTSFGGLLLLSPGMAGPPCFDFLFDVADNVAHLAPEDRLVQDPRAQELLDQAQEVLLKDLPAVPTWYRNAASGWSENVSNVTISWNGVPVYEDIEKN